MKNKIVTLLCILTILITTCIAAANSDGTAVISDEKATVTQLLNDAPFPYDEDGNEYVRGILVPMVGNYDSSSLTKEVTVRNNSEATPLYVKSTFYFEAGDLTAEEFYGVNSLMYIQFNNSDWNYSSWSTEKIEGKTYYTITATYKSLLSAGSTTSASLQKMGLKSAATNSDVAGFGEDFEIKVVSQGATDKNELTGGSN